MGFVRAPVALAPGPRPSPVRTVAGRRPVGRLRGSRALGAGTERVRGGSTVRWVSDQTGRHGASWSARASRCVTCATGEPRAAATKCNQFTGSDSSRRRTFRESAVRAPDERSVLADRNCRSRRIPTACRTSPAALAHARSQPGEFFPAGTAGASPAGASGAVPESPPERASAADVPVDGAILRIPIPRSNGRVNGSKREVA